MSLVEHFWGSVYGFLLDNFAMKYLMMLYDKYVIVMTLENQDASLSKKCITSPKTIYMQGVCLKEDSKANDIWY